MKAYDCRDDGTVYIYNNDIFFIVADKIVGHRVEITYARSYWDKSFSQAYRGALYASESNIKPILQEMR